jgi:hypothetical protein
VSDSRKGSSGGLACAVSTCPKGCGPGLDLIRLPKRSLDTSKHALAPPAIALLPRSESLRGIAHSFALSHGMKDESWASKRRYTPAWLLKCSVQERHTAAVMRSRVLIDSRLERRPSWQQRHFQAVRHGGSVRVCFAGDSRNNFAGGKRRSLGMAQYRISGENHRKVEPKLR